MSTAVKTTAGVFGLSDAKEIMRATLEIALLLLAGYFTLTDGVSELLHVLYTTYMYTYRLHLHVTDCNLSHECYIRHL